MSESCLKPLSLASVRCLPGSMAPQQGSLHLLKYSHLRLRWHTWILWEHKHESTVIWNHIMGFWWSEYLLCIREINGKMNSNTRNVSTDIGMGPRALAVHTEDLGFVSGSHLVVHTTCGSSSRDSNQHLVSSGTRHAQGAHTHRHSDTHKRKVSKFLLNTLMCGQTYIQAIFGEGQDGSPGKHTCHQCCFPEFSPWDPHRTREPGSRNWPQTTVGTLVHKCNFCKHFLVLMSSFSHSKWTKKKCCAVFKYNFWKFNLSCNSRE